MSKTNRTKAVGRRRPIDDWPAAHRKAFEDRVPRHWRPTTTKGVERSWSYWLRYCRSQNIPLQGAPSDGITIENLKQYILSIRTSVRLATAASYVRDMAEALRIIQPDATSKIRLLRNAASDLEYAAQPMPDVASSQIGASVIFERGLQLMTKNHNQSLVCWKSASAYLDGLMLAIGIVTGARRRTLTLTADRHLLLDGSAPEICFNARDVKTWQEEVTPLPPSIVGQIAHGLKVARFLADRRGQPWDGRLWVSRAGKPMSADSLYQRVCAATKKILGVKLNPQRLRRSLATSIHMFLPQDVGLATDALLHHSPRQTDSYAKGGRFQAVVAFHQMIHRGSQSTEQA